MTGMQKTGKSSALINKDEGGFVQDPDVEFCPALPWWVPTGNQSAHHADGFHHLSSPSQLGQEHHNSAGNKMSSEKGKEAIFSALTSVTHRQKDRFEITIAQPMVTNNPSHPPQLYGLFTPYEPHQTMGPVMLPMSLATNGGGTVYVNPKQYHGILRRRESRAKARLKAKPRPINKSYRHESRHRHAMRRPRGAGGRFLNSNELQAVKELPTNAAAANNHQKKMVMIKNKVIMSPNDHNYKYDHHQMSSNPSGSSNSEVFQNPNPNPSGSEVTSSLPLYGRQFDWFQVPPTADHGCCDFLKV